MASRDDLRLLAPEFADPAAYTNSRLDFVLSLAAQRLDAAAWGTLYVQGCLYLAAHLLTLQVRTAAAGAGESGAGPVTRRKAGDVEVSHGAAVGVLSRDAVYATTPYGIEFLALARSVGGVGAVVAGV